MAEARELEEELEGLNADLIMFDDKVALKTMTDAAQRKLDI